jgi:carboxyl-terminal processing protease
MSKALFRRLLGGLLTALALTAGARAEAPRAKAPQAYVVVVGISKYADKQIKPRPHAEADARALYRLFTDKDYLAADPRNVRLLLGDAGSAKGSEPATRENILKSLRWVAGKAKPNDLVVFAFLGEGGPLGESGERRCYFASDSTFKGRDKDAVTADEIGEAVKPLKSRRFCAFLDVDFRGFVAPDASHAVADATLGKSPYKEFLGDDGTDEHSPLPGRVVFLATNGLHPSVDLKDHGLFTQVLVAGLKGAADKEGYEPDGVVTVDELAEYLNKEVPELARKHGKTEKEREQLHFVLGGREAHFVLTTNPAVRAKVQGRLNKLAQLVRDGKIPAKDAEEGRALLERMPKLKQRQELRKAYQEFVDGKLTLAKLDAKREDVQSAMEMKRTEAFDFAQKVMEAVQLIRDQYVKPVNEGEMVGWAIRGLYRHVEEKVPEKIAAKLRDVKDMREFQLTALLAEARRGLGKREDLDKQQDLTVTLQRMLGKLDPYTTYIDPDTLARFTGDVEGHFKGIGVQIRKDSATDQLLVVTPIKGSPAYKKGMMAGDVITTIKRSVDSKGDPLPRPEVVPTKGLPLSKAVKLILGQEDTDVTLTLQREGVAKPFDLTITRGLVEVESVLGVKRKKNDNWDYWVDPKNKIAYVRLTNFARNTYRDLQRVTDELTKQGVKGLVLDLRFNPGGLLDSAVYVTDLFIDDGLIVKIRPRNGLMREKKFSGRHAGSLLDFPMVCLVNGYSASGAEIVSAALQDHKRALIIGERSYGKGSVQNIYKFEDGLGRAGEIKFTTATFWRPSGQNLNKSSTSGKEEEDWGVKPDKVVKLNAREREDLAEAQRDAEIIPRPDRPAKVSKDNFKDRQLDVALEYLRGQIKMASRVQPRKKAG